MKNTSSGRLGWLVLPSLWACHSVAVAQEDFYGNGTTNNFQAQTNNFASQSIGPTSPGTGQFGAPYMGTSALPASPATHAAYVPTGPPLAGAGPVGVYPHLLYSLIYGNGIQALPGKNSTTVINTIAPGMFLKLGGHWSLDYTPSLSFYSNPLFRDTTDHKVALNGVTTNGAWTLNLSQSYIDTTQPLVETGTQVEEQAYATALNAAWQTGGKSSIQLGLNQNFRFIPGLNDLHEWSTADWYNYQFQPRLGAGLGLSGGYDQMSLAPDMPFEQALGRVTFQPGAKLALTLVGGAEDRQFVHPSAPSLITPIFQASALYQICRDTSLTVSGNRSVVPSLYQNEVNVITTATADLRQRLVGKLYFDVSGGYTSEPFTSIEPGPLPKYFFGAPPHTTLVVTRADSRTYEQVRLSLDFRTRLTGSIFYMHNDNASSQSNYNYAGNQVGLELIYRY